MEMLNADKKTSFQKEAQNLEFQCIMDHWFQKFIEKTKKYRKILMNLNE